MQEPRHTPKTFSAGERLTRDSQNLRKQAEGMPAGVARDDLLRKARQADWASRVLNRLTEIDL